MTYICIVFFHVSLEKTSTQNVLRNDLWFNSAASAVTEFNEKQNDGLWLQYNLLYSDWFLIKKRCIQPIECIVS